MTSRTRIAREARTIEAMVRLYCHGQHAQVGTLCAGCADLLSYAEQRLARCPFQEGKTTCARCPVHCYKPEMRERVRTVMRYAGPRMLLRHPILTLQHLLDGLRTRPTTKTAKGDGNADRTAVPTTGRPGHR